MGGMSCPDDAGVAMSPETQGQVLEVTQSPFL